MHVVVTQSPSKAVSKDREHSGWFASMAAADMCASSAHTRTVLGRKPTGPGLLDDPGQPDYCLG